MRYSRRASGLYAAEMELPRGARGFMPAFGAPLAAPIATPGGTVPWWLSGGIAAANCLAAFQPKGAASLAASYVNLNNPGTYDVAPGVAPTFDTATGWTFNGTNQYLYEADSPITTDGFTIVLYGTPNTTGRDVDCFCSSRSATNKGYSFKANQYPNTQKIGFTVMGVSDYATGISTPTVATFCGFSYSGGTTKFYVGASTETDGFSTISASSQTGHMIAVSNNGELGSYYKGTIVGFARYSIVLSDAQMSALATATAAL